MSRVIQEGDSYELITSENSDEKDYFENLDEHIFFNISKVLKLEHINTLSLVSTTINKRLSDDGSFWKQKYQYKYSYKKHDDKLSWKDNYLNVGSVWYFGDKIFYNFGQNKVLETVPTKINRHNDIIAISAGYNYSLMLDVNGDVWSFGQNMYGQLGLSHTMGVEIPTKIEGLTDIIAISAGRHHSLVLDKNGDVWSFGSNDHGKLGLGDTGDFCTLTPTKIEGLKNITAISAGFHHSLALDSYGSVWAFGLNDHGQLGLGNTVSRDTPTKIEELASEAQPKGENIIAILAGRLHSLVLDSSGNVWSFGSNHFGQLGLGDRVDRDIPTKIEELENIKEVSSCSFSNLVLDEDGNTWSFGDTSNPNDPLDFDDIVGCISPIKLEGLNSVKAISTGSYHSLLMDKDGNIWSFGDNRSGQLGLGDRVDRDIPTKIKGLSTCIAISVGADHSLVLR